MEVSTTAPVGSIPTRSRHFFDSRRCPVRLATSLSLLTLLLWPIGARAQQPDSAAAPAPNPPPVARKAPIGPAGAFLRSFIIPGWGQLQLHRPVPALVFLGIEGTLAGLSIKANQDVKAARLTDLSPDSSVVTAKKRSREDWLVLLGFNHLMAGLEAYVSSHLWDFPGDLRIRATPAGVGATAVIPIRIR
jgi:hypothetical protein